MGYDAFLKWAVNPLALFSAVVEVGPKNENLEVGEIHDVKNYHAKVKRVDPCDVSGAYQQSGGCKLDEVRANQRSDHQIKRQLF